MLHVLKENGTKAYAALRSDHIVAGLDCRSKTPAAARNFLDTMKGLFGWAVKRKHVKIDPTVGVDRQNERRGRVFRSGPERTWRPTNGNFRSAPGSVFGST